MKKSPVIYPFFFAIYPILALYSLNISKVATKRIVTPLLVMIFLTPLLWVGLNMTLKNKKKSGLLLFLFMTLFFYYGHMQRLLLLRGYAIGEHKYLLSIWFTILILGTYLIIKTSSDLHNHTLVLNLIVFVLIISPLIRIVPYEFKRTALKKKISQARVVTNFNLQAGTPPKGAETPDIYYLIFDRYANQNILQESFDYDNSDVINYLTEKGFFVASKSQANYPKTFLSLTSSLNMDYLDYLAIAKESNDHTLIDDQLQDYKVWRFLKERGYTFIHFGDQWEQTRANSFADINVNYTPLGTNEFVAQLLENSLLKPVIEVFIGDYNTRHRKRIRYKFETLANIPEIEGPKFVFAHMLIPHDPYIFGPNGQPATETGEKSEVENYINQLIFTNNQIKQMIDQILSKSKTAPIIIIQSDEGPFLAPELLTAEFRRTHNWTQISPEALETHIGILNAYYLPGFDQNILYESISPVNSFRVIFNFYFGTDYKLLEDKSYISAGANLPYNFIEMSAISPF